MVAVPLSEPEAATVLQRRLTHLSTLKKQNQPGGFIRVFVRVRPLGEDRGLGKQLVNVDPAANCITVAAPQVKRRQQPASDVQRFDFEQVCDESADNALLLTIVGKPLIEAVCAGYNSTMLAYGQTGSGKSYTIGEVARLGTDHEGVAHRMIRELYHELAHMHCKQYKVSLQFVQIHLEHMHDVLAGDAGDGPRLLLREDKTHGIYVDGAQTKPAPTAQACLETLAEASGNLKVA